MIYIFLFLLTILLSIAAIWAGALALNLTGLPWEVSQFQALSAFSCCGFTTNVSESIARNPRRRKIVSVLMILGNTGFASSIIMLMRCAHFVFDKDILVEATYLIAIIFSLLGIYFIFFRTGILGWFTDITKKFVLVRGLFKVQNINELLHVKEGYGIARVEIDKHNKNLGKTLAQLRLSDMGIRVMAVERGFKLIPVPSENEKIEEGEVLICYGDLENIKKRLAFV